MRNITPLMSLVLLLLPMICLAAKIKPLVSSEVTPIDFGILGADNGICTMLSGGTLVASAGQSCSGIQTPGEFQIRGTNGQSINLSVTGGSAQGVTFRPVIDGLSIISMQGSSITVIIIGELELQGASQGSVAVPYVLTSNYE